ncbi:hypothetical protein [uncultured Alistipes sp.]|uniref:hypothetical protein n=1 Tax=uncultured Alistipes sp. TaxID=538949 RepID=UPI00259641F2|nr:hypothetical protein [uncultured Alistipes sp.]
MAENTTQRQVILDFDLNASGALKPGYKKPRSAGTGAGEMVISFFLNPAIVSHVADVRIVGRKHPTLRLAL